MKGLLHSAGAWSFPVSIIFIWALLLTPSYADDTQEYGHSQAREARLEKLREVLAVHRRQVRRALHHRNVVASGTALDNNGEPVIRVYLAGPDAGGVPDSLEGVRIRKRVTGRFFTLRGPTCDVTGDQVCASNESWPLPVPIGVSTGHPAISAGTIGARVTDGANVFMLSNNHVLANANLAKRGDPSLQPGVLDGGTAPDDTIATLSDFEPVEFCDCTFFFFGFCLTRTCPISNSIDAAISLSSAAELDVSTPTGQHGSLVGYGVPSAQLHSAFGDPGVIGDEDLTALLGTATQKVGRTTGRTTGTVDAVAATVNVCYDPSCLLEAQFDDQIMIVPGTFSAGGDSGSLIVTNDSNRQPIGLLFAGSATHTIANRIDLVLNRFGVSIDDGEALVATTDAAIAGVSAPTGVLAGNPSTVTASVRNSGSQSIAAGDIDVNMTDITEPDALTTRAIPLTQPLNPGAVAEVDFDWTPQLVGEHSLLASITFANDGNSANNTGTTNAVVTAGGTGELQLQLRNLVARTDAWTTVQLGVDYGLQMVVVCSPIYDLDTAGPALVRIRNASGSSFQVGVARPWLGALDTEQFSIDVHCMVVREGIYTEPENGVRLEAVRLEGLTRTDHRSSWMGEPRAYQQAYSSPVVLGQAVSGDDGLPPSNCPAAAGNICDPVWSVFWSRGALRGSPADAGNLYVGRHSGEDSTPRPAGSLHYIVIESGAGQIDGRPYRAALGTDSIRGMHNNPPFGYPLAGLIAPSTAIVSQTGMDGNNGGWAVVYSNAGLTASQLQLAIDEDWYLDSERSHVTEQVNYLVFE